MNLQPALAAPIAVQLHLLTVLPAFLIGIWLIAFSAKGKIAHRTWGYAYLALMLLTAIATLFIRSAESAQSIGFSWIHLFVPLTLFGVVGGLVAARKHDHSGHKRAMIGLFIGGLVVAGALTFLPGRIMNQIVTGG